MAADDCVKSQDPSADSLPIDMQTLKEHVEKALKKAAHQRRNLVSDFEGLQRLKSEVGLLSRQSSMTGVILTRVQFLRQKLQRAYSFLSDSHISVAVPSKSNTKLS